MNLLGIDPGLHTSAAVLLIDGLPRRTWLLPNADLLGIDAWEQAGAVAVESIEPRGNAVGADTFRTQWWSGRYFQHALQLCRGATVLELTRKDVKAEICGQTSASDSNVRQGVIDHFGGSAKALKGKRCAECKGKGFVGKGRLACLCCGQTGWSIPPGPLADISGNDVWAALAVALAAELMLSRRANPPRSERTKAAV